MMRPGCHGPRTGQLSAAAGDRQGAQQAHVRVGRETSP